MSRQKARWKRWDCAEVTLCRFASVVLALHLVALPTVPEANDDRDLSDFGPEYCDFEHEYWMEREGVPGQVSDLAQTTDGYLWLATGNSLFRFDGVSFERFRTPQGNPFPVVSALATHSDGSLWVGLRHGGLVRLLDGQTSSFGIAQGFPAGFPYDLAIDHNGSAVAAIGGQLVTGGEGSWRIHALDGAAENPQIRTVLVDRDGGTWAGGARLWYRASGHSEFVPSVVDAQRVTALAEAPDGRVWVAESTSATIFPVKPYGATAFPDQRYSHLSSAMVFDQEGGLWVGTIGDGVRCVPAPDSDSDQRLASFTGAKGLSGEIVGGALRDREGNIWIGTNAGLDRFRQPNLVEVGFTSAAYNFALAIDSGRAVWAGSMNRNAVRLQGSDLVTSQVPYPITVAHTNPGGQVWLAGPSGFWRSRGVDIEHIFDLPEGIDSTAVVRAIVEDDEGWIWASINEHGLYVWHDGVWSLEPVRGNLPSQRMPVRAVLGREGRPWFGYRDNLLVSMQNGQVLRWGPKDGLNVGHVTALLVTESRFWVGGSQGLSLFNGRSFVHMHFADGFRVSGLHGLVETATGELWLHGNDGLVRIEADQLARFLKHPSHLVKTKPLGPLEPLADDVWQLRPLPTALTSEDGSIWIATSVGVRRIDPHRVGIAEPPPPAHIVSLRADDGPIQAESGAVLPVLARRVVIAYTATGLKSPETLRFRYRLRGYDDAWYQPGSAREATYIGLPPGSFTFELSAAYGDGPWSVPDSMRFELPPAMHQTTQFIAVCATFAILLLWVAYRVRVRHLANGLRTRLEVRHRERDRIARELHDTLLQSVQGLILRFQAASNTLPVNEPARKSIEIALDLADQVMIEGRDRVTDLRIPQHRTGGLLHALAAIGEELAIVHGVEFQAIAQGKQPLLLPATEEEELFQIAREALINAFRHAHADDIELEISSDREGVRLRVRDDGAGMPATAFQRNGRAGHWGVTGMRERAEKIDARFEIWSREGSGTEVDIHLPWTSVPGHVQSNSGWQHWFKRRG